MTDVGGRERLLSSALDRRQLPAGEVLRVADQRFLSVDVTTADQIWPFHGACVPPISIAKRRGLSEMFDASEYEERPSQLIW